MKKAKQYKPKTFSSGKKYVANKRNARKYGYDKQWDAYRFRFLHHNPSCYCCPNPSKVVDHIYAHKGDQELFKELKNHMPLCTSCHNTITGKFDRKNPPDTEGKLRWVHEKRTQNNVTISIKVLTEYVKERRGRKL